MSCARSVRVFYEPGGGWDLVSSVRCLQVVISHHHVMPPSPAIEMFYSDDPARYSDQPRYSDPASGVHQSPQIMI